MATRQQQFYNEVYAGARQAGLSDARARLAAAQASLETGFGKSMPGGNMFGIKAGKSWTGPTQSVKTWEDVGGRVNIVDKFRSYTNPFDSLADWVGLTDRRFPAASAATSFAEATAGLNAGKPGGYATDRNYEKKLHQIDKKFGVEAQQNYGTMGRDLPIPSAAPRGVMEALGSTRQEIADFRDGGLRNASFPATPAAVERGGLLSDPTQTAGFDSGRFGPTTPNMSVADLRQPTFDSARFGPAGSPAQGFDNARFGATSPMNYDSIVAANRATRPQPASVAQFDSGRFGTATTNAQGVDGLRQGLLAQKAQYTTPQGILEAAAAQQPAMQAAKMDRLPAAAPAGPASFQGPVMPGMESAMANANLALDVADQRARMGLPAVNQPTVQPAYTDPMVSAQPAAPAQAVTGGVLGTSDPMTGGFGPSMTPQQAKAMERTFQAYRLGGGVLGGLLGGALLGPVGGMLGGYLGRNMGAKMYYPTAPQSVGQPKGFGRDSLSDRGRDAYESSKQFKDAVDSGKGGLW